MNPGPAIAWSDHSDFPLDWNGPVERPFDAFPDEAKSRPIIELLQAIVHRFPERIALTDATTSITYAEMWRLLTGRAERISESSAPGELVGIVAPVSIASPLTMLACLAAGRPFVALDPDYPPEWITHALADSGPALFLAASTGQGTIGPIPHALRTLDLSADGRLASPDWRPTHLGPDQAACILFTSGSTGQPKGVVNSQRNLLQRVSQSINAAHINSDDRFLTLTSLCTIVGIRDLFTALLAGASVCLLDVQNAGAREILRLIRDRRISILFAFPALLRSVVQSSQALAGENLRLVRVGGDTTLWSDVARLRAWMSPGTSIQSVYAATEAPMMQWFVGEIASGDEEIIPIGYPLPGNALAVLDENGAPTREGEIGELVVRSPYVALGIWSKGRGEGNVIDTDAIESTDRSMRIFKTGDLVRRRPDGLYDRIGRKDRQVKIRGARVELDGVEVAIRRHPSVRDVGVVARTDADGGAARLVAYVRPDDAASADFLDELKDMMQRAVPPQMRPWRFYATPVIPRLPNSKVDSRALRAMDAAKSIEETGSRPGPGTWIEKDPIEIVVAHVWRDVLGLGLAAEEDDFFDLGGDSLRAIGMTIELEKALGRELPINLINQAPTFAAFCATLRENGPAVYSPLVALKPGHGSRALFFVHGVGGGVMELFSLGRKITWPGAVIGIQARGMDGRDPPHHSVEAMADEYFTALKVRQPEGPYFLCGYSFGGLVAFELARRLQRRGDKVAFVGLLATLPPGHHFLRLWAWTAYLCRGLYQRLLALRDRPLPGGAGRASTGVNELRVHEAAPAALRAVMASALSASAAYRPGRYAGELTIFEPSSRDLRLPSSAILWGRHASGLQRHSLRGRHDDILVGANAEAAADLLTRCLEAAAKATSERAL
jgi:amino acid adenylation domain-containing protein